MPLPLSDVSDDCCEDVLGCGNASARGCWRRSSTALSAGDGILVAEDGEPPIGTVGQNCGKTLVFDPNPVQGAVLPPPTHPDLPDG